MEICGLVNKQLERGGGRKVAMGVDMTHRTYMTDMKYNTCMTYMTYITGMTYVDDTHDVTHLTEIPAKQA